MSTTISTELRELHVLRFVSFLHSDAVDVALNGVEQMFEGERTTETISMGVGAESVVLKYRCRRERVHDTVSLLLQAYAAQPVEAQNVAQILAVTDQIIASLDVQALGITTMIVAEVDDPIQLEAASMILDTPPTRLLYDEQILPDVWLYSADEPTRAVVFSGCEFSVELQRFLYGPLRVLETSYHKIQQHIKWYDAAYDRMCQASDKLEAELKRLVAMIETPDHCDVDGNCRDGLAQNGQTATAFRRLLDFVAKVEQIEITISANRTNAEQALRRSSLVAGSEFLASRIARADTAIAQIQADLSYQQPLLEQARWLTHFDQTRLLASLTATEAEEHRFRQIQTAKQDLFGTMLGIAALGIGLIQTWAAAVATLEDFSFWGKVVMMNFPIAAIAVVVWHWWKWKYDHLECRSES